MPPAAKRSERIDDIECLRAVAIIFTLIAHTPALYGASLITTSPYLSWGGGVDLFFVISGFVITKSFLRRDKLGSSEFFATAAAFWIRRVFRLFPAAWFWLAMSILAAIYLDRSTAFPTLEQTMPDVVAAFFQYANIHMYACEVLKSALCENGGVPNGVYWSLSLEEQFYLIFPFLILLVPRRWLTPALIVAVVWQVFVDKAQHFIWFIRSDGLGIGVLLALYEPYLHRFEPRFLSNAAVRLAILFALLAVIALSPTSSIPHTTGLTTVACGLLVFCASFDKDYVLPFTRLKPGMIWLGTRSYAMYLMHLIAFSASHEIWYRINPRFTAVMTPWSWYTLTGLVLCALGAELTFRFIETPSRVFGRHVAQRAQAYARPAQSVTGI
jgi:peptidoglycan/LPS O-acetylase OafA/YrhL